jgi:hypothetical protein
MNTSRAAFIPGPDSEALKAITRLQWTLNFEAVAAVVGCAGAIEPRCGLSVRPC